MIISRSGAYKVQLRRSRRINERKTSCSWLHCCWQLSPWRPDQWKWEIVVHKSFHVRFFWHAAGTDILDIISTTYSTAVDCHECDHLVWTRWFIHHHENSEWSICMFYCSLQVTLYYTFFSTRHYIELLVGMSAWWIKTLLQWLILWTSAHVRRKPHNFHHVNLKPAVNHPTLKRKCQDFSAQH